MTSITPVLFLVAALNGILQVWEHRQVTFLYQGYSQSGEKYDQIKHPIAVYLGGM